MHLAVLTCTGNSKVDGNVHRVQVQPVCRGPTLPVHLAVLSIMGCDFKFQGKYINFMPQEPYESLLSGRHTSRGGTRWVTLCFPNAATPPTAYLHRSSRGLNVARLLIFTADSNPSNTLPLARMRACRGVQG